MKYKLRYSPQAVKDLEKVEDDDIEASGRYDAAERYVDDLPCSR